MVIAVVLLVVLPLLAMAQGCVLHLLWMWFVVPLGVPPIGVAHAMGLAALFGLLLRGVTKEQVEPEPGEKAGGLVLRVTLKGLLELALILGFAGAARLAMGW